MVPLGGCQKSAEMVYGAIQLSLPLSLPLSQAVNLFRARTKRPSSSSPPTSLWGGGERPWGKLPDRRRRRRNGNMRRWRRRGSFSLISNRQRWSVKSPGPGKMLRNSLPPSSMRFYLGLHWWFYHFKPSFWVLPVLKVAARSFVEGRQFNFLASRTDGRAHDR